MTGTFRIASFLLINICLIRVSTADDRCPAVCIQGSCNIGSLHCREGGLTHIPKTLFPKTEKIVLSNHNFQNNILQRANFSNFATPRLITEVTISSCNIKAISQRTFSNLSKLKKLVLSNNKIVDLYADAFRGLNLTMLILNDNPHIRLNSNCFRGLTVVSLSLKKCQLSTLAYEVIKPIEGGLKTLMLSENRLKTLSPKFDSVFRQIKRLGLDKNPFECNCTLLWLSKVVAWKDQHGNLDNGFASDGGLFPKCTSPQALAGQFLHEIPEEKIQCAAPRLSALNLNVISSDKAELTCKPVGDGIINVIYRRYDSNNNVWNSVRGLPQSSDSPKPEPYKIQRSPRSLKEVFSCLIQDAQGRSGPTANVTINWLPTIELTRKPPIPAYKPPINVDLSKPKLDVQPKETDRNYENTVNKKNSDNDSENRSKVKTQEHFLFQKKFTLLEMIGAVVGTFTITLAIFLGIYRCFIHGRKKDRKKAPYSTYGSPTYDPSSMMFAPDTQTYDIPQLPNYPPPPPPSREQFLDYKTQRAVYNRV